MIKWDLFIRGKQEFFNICILVSMTYHIKVRNKTHMIILIDSEKAFDKIRHPFMIKTLQKVSIKETSLNT